MFLLILKLHSQIKLYVVVVVEIKPLHYNEIENCLIYMLKNMYW